MFELLKKYERRELLLILLLVGAVLLAPISTYVVWPEFKKFRAVSSARDALVATAANEGELAEELSALRVNVQGLEAATAW